MKKLSIVAVLAVMLMSLFAVGVSAQTATFNADQPVEILRISVDGDQYFDADEDSLFNLDTIGDVMRGENLDLMIKFEALADADDVDVEAEIRGVKSRYKSEDTYRFGEIHVGETYKARLTLSISEELDNDDEFDIRVSISGKKGDDLEFDIPFRVNAPENKLAVERVLFSPGQTVEAGRSLFTHVRVENFGQNDEEDVLVTFAIPELGVSDSAYVEEIEEDEEKVSQELFVSVPVCAQGEYEAKVTVEYDDDYETAVETYTVNVLPSTRCKEATEEDESPQTVMTVTSSLQNVARGGAEAVYPIALTNAGKESKTYTFEAVSGNGVNVRLSENLVVLGAGETKVVSVMLGADKSAPEGPTTATVLVKAAGTLVDQVTLNASVQDSSNGVKQGLTIALIVLVVLLVILGLIIGFSRLKDDDLDEDEQDDKTYY